MAAGRLQSRGFADKTLESGGSRNLLLRNCRGLIEAIGGQEAILLSHIVSWIAFSSRKFLFFLFSLLEMHYMRQS